jgi:hypothetical protein
MFDIFFLSYDEQNAASNFAKLQARFPHARRVHGVKGIANAHFEAARRSNTKWFYVVDADAEVDEAFNFDYQPPPYDSKYVHIWGAFNPATGTIYGYGGVKLFNKEMFDRRVRSQLDFSTTLAKGIKLMPGVSCITRFNVNPLTAFRGAFREATKLSITAASAKSAKERKEARERLAAWIDPVPTCANREHVLRGARAGIKLAAERGQDGMHFINDPELVAATLRAAYPHLDFRTDPTPEKDHLMKREFFFMNRIASAMYDPYVLEHLPITQLRDAISDGQVLSKLWLIEELKKVIDRGEDGGPAEGDLRVAILGGWIGTLALMMAVYELPVDITSIDLDERANRIAEKLNYDFKFETRTMDMYDVNYGDYDVIINTSSEHIPDIPAWRALVPPGKLLIVQNNNMVNVADHISTVETSGQLHDLLNLRKVHYEGTRNFGHFSRFMLIGST